MQGTKNLVVLSVDQAREALVNHFTNFLVDNRAHLAAMIREGSLSENFPNLKTATADQVVQLYRDNGVGASARTAGVDAVAIHKGGFNLEVVYQAPKDAQDVKPVG